MLLFWNLALSFRSGWCFSSHWRVTASTPPSWKNRPFLLWLWLHWTHPLYSEHGVYQSYESIGCLFPSLFSLNRFDFLSHLLSWLINFFFYVIPLHWRFFGNPHEFVWTLEFMMPIALAVVTLIPFWLRCWSLWTSRSRKRDLTWCSWRRRYPGLLNLDSLSVQRGTGIRIGLPMDLEIILNIVGFLNNLINWGIILVAKTIRNLRVETLSVHGHEDLISPSKAWSNGELLKLSGVLYSNNMSELW